jgi:hypothetical protein
MLASTAAASSHASICCPHRHWLAAVQPFQSLPHVLPTVSAPQQQQHGRCRQLHCKLKALGSDDRSHEPVPTPSAEQQGQQLPTFLDGVNW